MSERDTYPAGVPCWIEALQPDVEAAKAFYGELLGWEFTGGPMPGGGRYNVGQLRGRDVAGIAPLPPMAPDTPPGWITQVRVDEVEGAVAACKAAGADVLMPAFDAPPAGRLGVVADPGGAVFGLWEPRDRQGAQRVNEAGAWAMSLLLSDDPERAAAFYAAAFGWTTERFTGGGVDVTMFRLPGYVGGEPEQPVSREVVAVMLPRGDGETDSWRVDFWVDDVDASADQAARLGGSLVSGPRDAPAGRNAVIADPAGVRVSITEAPATARRAETA